MVRVMNDLLRAVDKHNEAALVLLDLSAAFDTIDQELLLQRLSERFGIHGIVLAFFRSYLTGRSQFVNINNTDSDKHMLFCGVPQGSVLGPQLFTMYISPVEDIINAHGLEKMQYADDTQIYTIFKKSETTTVLSRLEQCIDDVKAWMIQNKLKLNDSKTELIHVTSQFINSAQLPPVTIGTSLIEPSPEARDLGILVDDKLSLNNHVTNICRTATYAIWKISQIRKYLDNAQTERLVHAFITSHLDNCNSLLYGLPCAQIDKLQRIQNTAARLITRTKKYDHISGVLEQLHWLPIHKRIIYKILLLTYKAVNGQSPEYIAELVSFYNPPRSLRSSSQRQLVSPRFSTSYAKRAFSVAAPTLWNKLPIHIRQAHSLNSFKSQLKSHLFISNVI